MIFPAQALTLLLHGFKLPILLCQLVLKRSNLPSTTSLLQFLCILALGLGVTFVALDFLFETEGVEDHAVCAIEDEGKEEGETAEVHVALGIELARLHFHAFGAGHCRTISVSVWIDWDGMGVIRCSALVFAHGEFDLDTIDTIDAVNEEDQDEDEGDLDP